MKKEEDEDEDLDGVEDPDEGELSEEERDEDEDENAVDRGKKYNEDKEEKGRRRTGWKRIAKPKR